MILLALILYVAVCSPEQDFDNLERVLRGETFLTQKLLLTTPQPKRN